jgi:hypothetical protein
MRIGLTAAVEARLKAIQPEDSVGDGGVGLALPSQSNRFPALKGCPDRLPRPNLLSDSMQAEGRLVGTGLLAGAETGSRSAAAPAEDVLAVPLFP